MYRYGVQILRYFFSYMFYKMVKKGLIIKEQGEIIKEKFGIWYIMLRMGC